MSRKPLIPLYKAQQLYDFETVKRPQFVDDGCCQWCGKQITNKRRKSFCCEDCSIEFHRIVTWGRTRGAYSNYIVWRDNLTCQDCGKFLAIQNEFGVYIPAENGAEVHHILPVSQGGTDNPNNLITLCKDCHKLRHKKLKELNGND